MVKNVIASDAYIHTYIYYYMFVQFMHLAITNKLINK